MTINLNRRSIITGLISLVAAPAIVRATSIMPVRAVLERELWICTMAGITCNDGDVRFDYVFPTVPTWESSKHYELGDIVCG